MSENTITAKQKKGIKRESVILIGMFFVYAVLTFIGALNHEIWYDEAQAWNIARDNDISGIISVMKYEGHPPLWHFLLKIFVFMGCTADILPFISWFITCVAAALLLWKAPFKPLMKGVILFSGGFLFYWSIVSRIYCVIVLLLVLIAMNYKNRNEHPLIFGLLIALMANTHIMMCGFVGMIGIFMIIDLFKLWKTSTKKMNLMRLLGLAVAGAGVIALILPLLGCLQANKYTSSNMETVDWHTALMNIYLSFGSITKNVMLDQNPDLMTPFLEMICLMIGVSFVIMLFFLRHYRRAFFIQLGFTIPFVMITCVLWWLIPVRAEIFVFLFVITLWIGLTSEEPSVSVLKLPEKMSGSSFGKIIAKFENADKGFQKSICAVLCVYITATIPVGAYMLISDYTSDFTCLKPTLEFIQQELPKGSVIITTDDAASSYTAYLQDYKFYALTGNRFYTYCDHKASVVDYEQAYEDLKGYSHTYMMLFFSEDSPKLWCVDNTIFSIYGNYSSWVTLTDKNVTIFPVDIERDIDKFRKFLEEN